MVRHYVDNRRPELTVVIDDRDDSLPGKQFEVAMEITASLGVTSMLQQQPMAVWNTAGPILGRTKPGGRDDLLDRLAAAVPQLDGDPTKAALTAIRSEAGTSALVLVTGGLPAEDLMILASQARRHVRVLIVRVWPDGQIEPGVLPGAIVMDVDSLDRFARAWDRVAR